MRNALALRWLNRYLGISDIGSGHTLWATVYLVVVIPEYAGVVMGDRTVAIVARRHGQPTTRRLVSVR